MFSTERERPLPSVEVLHLRSDPEAIKRLIEIRDSLAASLREKRRRQIVARYRLEETERKKYLS
jgi:hypothetical protein